MALKALTSQTLSTNRFNIKRVTNPRVVDSVGIFGADPNSANLWVALSLTNYQNTATGGALVDLAPQIRGNTAGQTAGTAKTYNAGTGTQSTASPIAPFAQYTSAFAFPSSYGSTNDLTYTSTALGSNQVMTFECRVFVPSGSGAGTLIQTNNFSGGYYNSWVFYVNSSSQLAYFSNYGSTTGTLTSSGTVTRNAWNHVAMVVDGSTNMKMFINGTRVYNAGYGQNASGAGPTTIGPSYWDGYGSAAGYKMVDYRIYTGIQKYTTDFTVSSTNVALGGAILV